MVNDEGLATRLKRMGRRGWTLKPYNMWGKDKPCPPRLVVNVYQGCEFAHKYCYIADCVKPQEGFREHLQDRIREAKRLGLEDVFVIVSSSTDPFQPIEREKRDSLFALDSLLSNGFPVLVMTRNPQILLEKEYRKVIENPRLYVDVSVPSTHENDPDSVFYSAIAPSLDGIFGAIRELSDTGIYVRVKVEPIVPTTNMIHGQTEEEIKEVIRRSKDAGVKTIISKTMRLNEHVPRGLYDALIVYYQSNGERESYGNTTNLVLRSELRRQLLQPVYEASREYAIPFCACVDADVFSERTVSCRFEKY
ncbi:MAG: radical SAM protein [Candidatus Woesearchaeota archaeon]|jgi:DNA repair photolyase